MFEINIATNGSTINNSVSTAEVPVQTRRHPGWNIVLLFLIVVIILLLIVAQLHGVPILEMVQIIAVPLFGRSLT